MIRFTLILCFIGSFHLHSLSQLPAEMQWRVDSVFAHWNGTDRPGGALAIVQNGKIIYKKGYGLADLEHGEPISPKTVFYAGSVSKQFVAMAILLLEEAGKLSIEDDIRKFLPEMPNYGNTIAIRHLLHHTSGLRDYLALMELRGSSYLDYMPKEAVFELICRQKGLNFSPGERYDYSNSGYFLLALIVERISGKTFRQFTQEHIFQPLGMESSFFNDNLYELISNRAFGYRTAAVNRFEPLFMRFALVGSGGLYTTVEDLYKWDQNFYHNKLGKGQASLIAKMQTDGKLNNGESCGYAFALVNGNYRGLPTIGHTGSLGGYRSYYVRFPEQYFSIILLGNVAEFAPSSLAMQIADILLKDAFPEEPAPQIMLGPPLFLIQFTEEELQTYPGRYYSEELDIFYRISRKDNALYVQVGFQSPQPLENMIQQNYFLLTPVRDKKNKITAMQLSTEKVSGINFRKME